MIFLYVDRHLPEPFWESLQLYAFSFLLYIKCKFCCKQENIFSMSCEFLRRTLFIAWSNKYNDVKGELSRTCIINMYFIYKRAPHWLTLKINSHHVFKLDWVFLLKTHHQETIMYKTIISSSNERNKSMWWCMKTWKWSIMKQNILLHLQFLGSMICRNFEYSSQGKFPPSAYSLVAGWNVKLS